MRFVRGAKVIAYDHNGGWVDEVAVDEHGRLERPMSVPTGGSVTLQGYAFGPLRNALQASTIAGISQYVDRVETRTFCPHGDIEGWTHCARCRGDATLDDIGAALSAHVLTDPGSRHDLPSRAVQRPNGMWTTAPDTGTSPGVQEALQPPGTDEARQRVESTLETAYSAHYAQGHQNGWDDRQADWSFALDEYCDLPEDVDDEDPEQVAKYITLLQDRLRAARG